VIDCSPRGIAEMAPILGKEIKLGYQVPLSDYVRRHADIMTMAVVLIIHGDQAEQILRDSQSRSDRGRARNPQQPELADGRRTETRRGGPVPQRAAAVRLLAGHPREAGIRDAAVDVAKRAAAVRGVMEGERAYDKIECTGLHPRNETR
jgi:hypothetical protein